VCVPCELGTSWNPETKQCVSVPAGTLLISILSVFMRTFLKGDAANLKNNYVIQQSTQITFIPGNFSSFSSHSFSLRKSLVLHCLSRSAGCISTRILYIQQQREWAKWLACVE
jgi:hypothetical protein